ncbi:MAG: outer membrane beta-barrel protein [Algibacter sp.]|uniref:porin family protein n=1 Tax=Algibacter sp. TaxID=1872428 RepID=UPI00262E48CF|nr:outer membrane beta-barrel protein [Algibacter sp.]MDG1728672.1 outer membrane beta-barrel protein [Algibacter sp.]MDG2177316.1 outer membrane beta-barrel protein [Algibacter sp.]
MKKLLLLTVLFGFSFHGFSQDNETITASEKVIDSAKVQEKWSASSGIKYGIRGGYTISHLDFETDPMGENKHRNSMYVGFFASIGLSRTLSLMPEIQFSAEGANAEPLHLDYIQMPVLFRFRFSEKFHAGLGPQIGLKVHKTDDGLKNLGYSAVIGADYKINYALFVDVRYNYGIRNVFDEVSGIVAKNRTIQLGVGYKF